MQTKQYKNITERACQCASVINAHCSIVQTILYIVLPSISYAEFSLCHSKRFKSHTANETHMKYDAKFIHIFIAFKTINFDSLSHFEQYDTSSYLLLIFLCWNLGMKHFDAVESHFDYPGRLSFTRIFSMPVYSPALHHGLSLEMGTVRCHWK